MIKRYLYVLLVLLVAAAGTVSQAPARAQAADVSVNQFAPAVIVDSPGGRLIVEWYVNVPGQITTDAHVSIADIDSGKVLRTFSLPDSGLLAVHPGSDDAYFVKFRGTTIDHVNLRTGVLTKIADLPSGFSAQSLVLNPATSKLYVSNASGTSPSTNPSTIVVDERTQSITGSIPYYVGAVNPTADRLYCINYDAALKKDRLLTLDGATDSPLGDPLLLDSMGFISSFAVNSTTGRVYIVSQLGPMYVVDGIANKVVYHGTKIIENVGAINEKENKVYGRRSNGPPFDTTIIDGTSLAVLGQWSADGWPVAADSVRNLVIFRPGFSSGTDGLVFLVADGHDDTIQRRIVISPAQDVPSAVQPIPPFPHSADRVFFPQTGHSLSYGFKHYWEQNGGLAIFGYPITEEFQEGGYTVQYFERARFEYHPEFAGTPSEVELGLLGDSFAARRAPVPDTGTDSQHAYFPETGQYLSYGFKYYWDHNGGIPIFGLPITGEFSEVNPIDGKTYTVQYFERARFEYHPEFAGTPYETELGLLGDQALQVRGWR